MLRIFKNVGNALFTVEEIMGKYFVYDCGGPSKDIINKAINEVFTKDGIEIEAVFISHFDKDHINGIHYLLKNFKVRRLFIPELARCQKLALIFTQSFDNNQLDLLIDPFDYVEKNSVVKTIVIEVKQVHHREIIPNNSHSNSNDDSVLTFDNIDSYIFNHKIESGEKIFLNEKKSWVYILWNINVWNEDETEKFLNEIKYLISSYSEKKLYALDEMSIKKLWTEFDLCKNKMIKGAFQKVINNFNSEVINEYSLIMYSGFDTIKKGPKFGCLYFGDFNANKNWTSVTKAFSDVWHLIGTVQIPHHGSMNNFCAEMIEDGTIAIISASKQNGRIKSQGIGDSIIENGGFVFKLGCCGDVFINLYDKKEMHAFVETTASVHIFKC